jgi:hypothetical protein
MNETTNSIKQCFSCRGFFPDIDGPVHLYMKSTPGCWAAFGKALVREYENPRIFTAVHWFTVDTYAAQHPGSNDRKAVQSVNVHLLRLYCILEKGWKPESVTRIMKKLLLEKADFNYLEPPSFEGALNVSYLAEAAGDDDYIKRAKEWAGNIWSLWKEKHIDEINILLKGLEK